MSNRELINRLNDARGNWIQRITGVTTILLDAADALEAHEWRPIETAPKNGVEIRLFGYIHDWLPVGADRGEFQGETTGFWDDCRGVFQSQRDETATYTGFTHWKPIAPPEDE